MERRIVMKGLGYRAFALMVVALLLSAAALAQGQGKGKPGGGGGDGDSPPSAFGEPVIAFVNKGAALMLMDAENNIKQLFAVTQDGHWVGSPSWGPPIAGEPDRIAFSSSFEGSWGLYVIDADGQNLMRLSAIGGLISGPVWSPDGRWIAFADNNPDPDVNDSDIFLLDVACAEAEVGSSNCLWHFVTPEFDEAFPTWAPSSDRLAAKAVKYDSSSIELIVFDISYNGFEIDGFQLQVLHTDPDLSKPEGEGNLPSPAWSQQTDQWLAVLSRNADFSGDLYLIDTVSSEAFNLTNCPECDNLQLPSWSPCNSKLVVSTRDPQNKKNQSYRTLAFVDLSFPSGVPQLDAITYVTRAGKTDSYNQPAWKGGVCAP